VKSWASKIAAYIPDHVLDRFTPKELFARLDIASKMLSGYMVLVLLTVIVVTFALFNIKRLNNLNTSIVTIDVPVQEASDKMLEAIIAQDGYEKRFLILNDPDIKNLFLKRGDEFRQWFETVQRLPKNIYHRIDEI